jgi:hypothetical protein
MKRGRREGRQDETEEEKSTSKAKGRKEIEV